jgi:hypothetical protein
VRPSRRSTVDHAASAGSPSAGRPTGRRRRMARSSLVNSLQDGADRRRCALRIALQCVDLLTSARPRCDRSAVGDGRRAGSLATRTSLVRWAGLRAEGESRDATPLARRSATELNRRPVCQMCQHFVTRFLLELGVSSPPFGGSLDSDRVMANRPRRLAGRPRSPVARAPTRLKASQADGQALEGVPSRPHRNEPSAS